MVLVEREQSKKFAGNHASLDLRLTLLHCLPTRIVISVCLRNHALVQREVAVEDGPKEKAACEANRTPSPSAWKGVVHAQLSP